MQPALLSECMVITLRRFETFDQSETTAAPDPASSPAALAYQMLLTYLDTRHRGCTAWRPHSRRIMTQNGEAVVPYRLHLHVVARRSPSKLSAFRTLMLCLRLIGLRDPSESFAPWSSRRFHRRSARHATLNPPRLTSKISTPHARRLGKC